MSDGSASADGASRSKVARVIDSYDLEGEGDRLVAEWTGSEAERSSLRELAGSLNRRLLAAAMDDAGMDPIDGEVGNVYRLLTEDDVSSGTYVEVKNRLEREGVDVEAIESDFVSRQAIHTYLTKYRDAEYEAAETDDEDRVDDRLETVQRLTNRVSVVTDRILSELGEAELLTLGDVDVRVAVRVHCSECGTQYDVAELLDRGGCECEE